MGQGGEWVCPLFLVTMESSWGIGGRGDDRTFFFKCSTFSCCLRHSEARLVFGAHSCSRCCRCVWGWGISQRHWYGLRGVSARVDRENHSKLLYSPTNQNSNGLFPLYDG